MNRIDIRLAVLILLLVIGPFPASTASARKIEDWPYERLFEQADVVVLVFAIESKDGDDMYDGNPWKAKFLAVNTRFRVEHFLKGKHAEKEFEVLHYRLKEGVMLEDGPLLVTFQSKAIMLETKMAKVILPAPEYLLFLKMSDDGILEPVSGKIDPQLSVREMRQPLPREIYDDK